MRILHISDLHLPAPEGSVRAVELLFPKRFLGWANLKFRRKQMFADGMRKLERLVALVKREGVDVTLFTGDVSSLGTDGELAFCRKAIEPLVEASPEFICMPGNHDVYLSRGPWRRHFSDLALKGEPTGDGPEGWPRKYNAGNIRIVAVDVAKPNPHLYSTGRVPADQLLGLREAILTDRPLVIAMHHGPFDRHGAIDRRTHRIVNTEPLLAVLRDAPSGSLLLHGHTHHRFLLRPSGLPAVLCAGSACQRQRESAWILDRGQTGAWEASPVQWHDDYVVEDGEKV